MKIFFSTSEKFSDEKHLTLLKCRIELTSIYIHLHTLQVEDEKFVQISGKSLLWHADSFKSSDGHFLSVLFTIPFGLHLIYLFQFFSHLQYLIYSSILFKPLVFTIHLIPNLQLTTNHSIPNLQLHSVNTSIFLLHLPFSFSDIPALIFKLMQAICFITLSISFF